MQSNQEELSSPTIKKRHRPSYQNEDSSENQPQPLNQGSRNYYSNPSNNNNSFANLLSNPNPNHHSPSPSPSKPFPIQPRKCNWTKKERIRYLVFTKYYSEIPYWNSDLKSIPTYKSLSLFIKTRSPEQSKSFHLSIKRYYPIMDELIMSMYMELKDEESFDRLIDRYEMEIIEFEDQHKLLDLYGLEERKYFRKKFIRRAKESSEKERLGENELHYNEEKSEQLRPDNDNNSAARKNSYHCEEALFAGEENDGLLQYQLEREEEYCNGIAMVGGNHYLPQFAENTPTRHHMTKKIHKHVDEINVDEEDVDKEEEKEEEAYEPPSGMGSIEAAAIDTEEYKPKINIREFMQLSSSNNPNNPNLNNEEEEKLFKKSQQKDVVGSVKNHQQQQEEEQNYKQQEQHQEQQEQYEQQQRQQKQQQYQQQELYQQLLMQQYPKYQQPQQSFGGAMRLKDFNKSGGNQESYKENQPQSQSYVITEEKKVLLNKCHSHFVRWMAAVLELQKRKGAGNNPQFQQQQNFQNLQNLQNLQQNLQQFQNLQNFNRNQPQPTNPHSQPQSQPQPQPQSQSQTQNQPSFPK